jgi:Flp pilus assembly pilin Flp
MVDGRRGAVQEEGQASVEHAALVALVALVLAGAVAAAGAFSGVGIVNAVHSGIRRALCVAGGDDCAPFHVQQPCAIARDEDAHVTGLSIGFWRLGEQRSVAVERRSDGSVAVTVYDDVEGGVGASVGVRFGIGRSTKGDGGLVRAAAGKIKIKATAGVEARLRGGWGQTWEFGDGPAADAFLRRLQALEEARQTGGDVPAARRAVRAPDVERVRLGADGTVTGEVSGLKLSAGGSAALGLRGEGTRDRRTGTVTVGLALPAAVAGELAAPLGVGLGRGLRVEPSATLTFDRDLRPRELRVVGQLTTREGTRRRDVQVRVDLTRPEAARGVAALADGLKGGDLRAAREAATVLGRWAAAEGWVDEREFRTGSETEGIDTELALGLKLGVRDQEVHSTERLVSARTRPPGGLWEGRTDCFPVR